MQQLQICIGPIIRIGRESWCLPYAGFFSLCCQSAAASKQSENEENKLEIALLSQVAMM